MASGVANPKVRRFGFAKDAVFKDGAGTFVNPSAYHDVVVNPAREAIARDEDANSFGDAYPPDAGVQSVDASVVIDASDKFFGDCGDLCQSALGAKQTPSALTWAAGVENTQGAFKFSAGTPAPIVPVVGDDGKTYLRPVKSDTGTVATLGVELPAGVVAAGAANPSDKTGGCFNYLLGMTADTYMLEFDRPGQSKQIKYRGQGCAVSALGLKFERRKRLGFSFGFKGAGWLANPGGMQLADPAVRSTPFISFCADVFIQDLTTPVAGIAIPLKAMSLDLAPELIEETGTLGLDGSGNVSQSDILGYTRGLSWIKNRLKLTLTYPSAGYHTDFTGATSYQVFVVFYPGRPGAAAAVNRIGLWLPKCQLAAEPKLVTADNQESMELEFSIGRDTSLSRAAAHLAFTNT